MVYVIVRGFILIIVFCVLAASAALLASYYDRDTETGPIELAESIRARACSGEVESFYELIDKDSVEFSTKRSELERIRKDYLFSTQEGSHHTLELKKYILSTVPELVGVKWKIYESQVRAGKSGPICNMDIVRAGNGESTVKLKFPDGERSTWKFGKVGEEWKVVSIDDVKPLKLLSMNESRILAASTKVEPDKPSQTETANIKKNSESEDTGEESQATQVTADKNDSEPELHASVGEQEAGKENALVIKPEEETSSAEKDQKDSSEQVMLSSGNDFRTVSWGATPKQVRMAEGGEPGSKSPGLLTYDTYFKGESVKVQYKFSENRLKSGGIQFLNEHPEEIFYVQDYEKRRAELTAKYGEPEMSEEIWYNRIYEGMPDRMGFAVAIGHLKLRTKWRTERSEVLLELKSEDYDMTLVLSYHSR